MDIFAGTGNQTVGYNVNGEANDWFYGEQVLKDKAFAFTPEVGTSFWAPSSEIIPYGQENVRMNAIARPCCVAIRHRSFSQ